MGRQCRACKKAMQDRKNKQALKHVSARVAACLNLRHTYVKLLQDIGGFLLVCHAQGRVAAHAVCLVSLHAHRVHRALQKCNTSLLLRCSDSRCSEQQRLRNGVNECSRDLHNLRDAPNVVLTGLLRRSVLSLSTSPIQLLFRGEVLPDRRRKAGSGRGRHQRRWRRAQRGRTGRRRSSYCKLVRKTVLNVDWQGFNL